MRKLSKPFWLIRVALKNAIRRIGRADELGEYCDECGKAQPLVWWSSNRLWKEVTGSKNGKGVLCPRCFDARADNLGILLRWHPVAEFRADRHWREQVAPSLE